MLYQEGLKTLKKGLEKGISKNDFLKSGFKKLDKKYGGIFKKGITVIAGTNQDDLTNFGVSLLKNISLNKFEVLQDCCIPFDALVGMT